MRNISLDIETYSSTELAKGGVYKYAEAPDFEILLLSYSMDGGPVMTVDIACGELFPPEVQVALLDEAVMKWAFNAQFERICLSRHLGQWRPQPKPTGRCPGKMVAIQNLQCP